MTHLHITRMRARLLAVVSQLRRLRMTDVAYLSQWKLFYGLFS
jgi:hypothetical protein